MCEFVTEDGIAHLEADYAEPDGTKGWRNFPLKKKVVSVKLLKRIITPDIYRVPGEQIKGFAVHWIGSASPGKVNPFVSREVMIVQKNMRVMCFCLRLKDKRWFDYTDNLKNPERPHLFNYNLSAHGM